GGGGGGRMPGASLIAGGWSWDCTNPNDTNDNSDDCEGAVNDPKGAMGAWEPCPFQQATARSRHSGGVMVAMGDGSARFITDRVPQTIWWCMCSRNDGVSYTPP